MLNQFIPATSLVTQTAITATASIPVQANDPTSFPTTSLTAPVSRNSCSTSSSDNSQILQANLSTICTATGSEMMDNDYTLLDLEPTYQAPTLVCQDVEY